MKCDMCDKSYGVLTIMAGVTVHDQATEDSIRDYIKNQAGKEISTFPHLEV